MCPWKLHTACVTGEFMKECRSVCSGGQQPQSERWGKVWTPSRLLCLLLPSGVGRAGTKEFVCPSRAHNPCRMDGPGCVGWTKLVRQMNGLVIYTQKFYFFVHVCLCVKTLREQTARRDPNLLSEPYNHLRHPHLNSLTFRMSVLQKRSLRAQHFFPKNIQCASEVQVEAIKLRIASYEVPQHEFYRSR